MTTTQSTRHAIESSVHHYINLARELFVNDIVTPKILFTKTGSSGGHANITDWHLNFNENLMIDNMNEYINQVVPHEVAHLVVHAICGVEYTVSRFGKRRRVIHGKKFKAVMRAFGCDTSTTHRMDTSKVKATRKTTKYTVVCTGCQYEGTVGKIRANKIANGSRYTHRCGGGRKALIKLK